MASRKRDTSGRPYRRRRERVKRAFGYVCHLCGQPIPRDARWPDPASFSVHHVQPASHGGTDQIDNFRPAHLACNRKTGNRPPRRPLEDRSAAW